MSNDFGSSMGKNEADNLMKINISFLKKKEFLCGFRSGTITWTRNGAWGERKNSVNIDASTLDKNNNYIQIYYTQTDRNTGEKKYFDYKIPLTTTPCRYGGKRYWFICPWYKKGIYCGKRVGILYKDGDYFACRHCYNLTYNSRKNNRRNKFFPLSNMFTLEERIEKLRKQIKRHYYKNKPTRKFKQLLKLCHKSKINSKNNDLLNFKNML